MSALLGYAGRIAALSGYPEDAEGFEDALRYAEARLEALLGGPLEDGEVTVSLDRAGTHLLPPGVVLAVEGEGEAVLYGSRHILVRRPPVSVRLFRPFSPSRPEVQRAAAEFVSRYMRLPDPDYVGDRYFPEVLAALLGGRFLVR